MKNINSNPSYSRFGKHDSFLMYGSPKRLTLPFALIIACTLLFASCRKTCSCTAYDGSTTKYSKAEVEASGGSCSGMIFMFGTRYYSLCEWD